MGYSETKEEKFIVVDTSLVGGPSDGARRDKGARTPSSAATEETPYLDTALVTPPAIRRKR